MNATNWSPRYIPLPVRRLVPWIWSVLCLVVVVIWAIPIDNSADSVYGTPAWVMFVVAPVAAIWALGLG